jgi:hypothetical protein
VSGISVAELCAFAAARAAHRAANVESALLAAETSDWDVPVWLPVESAVLLALSVVCAEGSALFDAAAVESAVTVAVVVRAVASFVAVVAATAAAVPSALALKVAAVLVLTRSFTPNAASSFVPALLGVFASAVAELTVLAASAVVATALVAPALPVAAGESELPLHAVVPLAGAVCCADACCGELCCAEVGCVWAGLAGALVADPGALAGADVLASSQAAKGVSSLSWLGVDGCERADAVSETATAISDAILGTGELPESTLAVVCLQPAGHRAACDNTFLFNDLGAGCANRSGQRLRRLGSFCRLGGRYSRHGGAGVRRL